ncbi:MAG: hypothetical protein ABI894_18100 [Ilumatobacteraceae bacterium]
MGINVSQDESVEQSHAHVIDLWNGEVWIPFEAFNNRYELAGTDWSNNVYRR